MLGLPRSTGEGSRLELEVGDITRGMEMRSESSPVEKSAERNKHDVVVRVSGRHEAVAVVRLQSGAQVPDGSGIERRGGHFVEEEKSREEAGLNEEQRKQKRHEMETKCLSESRNNPRGQTLCRNRYQQKINRFLGKAECCHIGEDLKLRSLKGGHPQRLCPWSMSHPQYPRDWGPQGIWP